MDATIDTNGVDLSQRRTWAITEILLVLSTAAAVLAVANALDNGTGTLRTAGVAVTEALVIGTIWWSQRRRERTLADLGLTVGLPDLRTVGRTIGWSVVVAAGSAALWLASAATLSLIAGEPQASDVSMYDHLRGNLWALLGLTVAVWVTSSFAEEVIYRGFLIHRLEEAFAGGRHATTIAVVVGGLIFGAVHYAWGPVGMILTGLVGIAWGVAYVTLGRRLWIVILAHGYMDTLLFVQIYFMTPSGG